ncbi:catechol 1,2-dioxygenase [Rhodococcus sp. OK519]|uniref:dioxygenase family protein n=1 Tax=Rhodococcus sp. OK519 TaxID=2135729 RepID=UPI000D37F9D5|nr:catechol 1,2-dioxygenase [Rhodococcus sp. OK519]
MLFSFRFPTRVSTGPRASSPDTLGSPLLLTGRVHDSAGRAVRGATVGIRRSDSSGTAHAGAETTWTTTDGDGHYSIRTTTPVPYQISTHGAIGWFMANEGWSPWRPGHLHVTVKGPRMHTTTTRPYFRRDAWTRHDAPESALLDLHPGAAGMDRTAHDFVMERRAQPSTLRAPSTSASSSCAISSGSRRLL